MIEQASAGASAASSSIIPIRPGPLGLRTVTRSPPCPGGRPASDRDGHGRSGPTRSLAQFCRLAGIRRELDSVVTSRGNCQRNVTCDVSLLVIRVIVSQSHESATARLSHPGRHGGSAPWLPGRAADPLRRARSAEGRPDSVGVQVSGIMSSVRQSTQLNLAVTLAVSDPGPGEFKCRVTSHGHRRRGRRGLRHSLELGGPARGGKVTPPGSGGLGHRHVAHWPQDQAGRWQCT